jgi:glycosyltransferase involved in cell wall biosynthesis
VGIDPVPVIEAFQLFLDADITPPLVGLLLGDPDNKNLSSISCNRLEKWSNDKTIEWLPAQKDVKEYIQQSKIAVLPSFREGFPKSLLGPITNKGTSLIFEHF